MTRSENIASLSEALSKAQGKIKGAAKDSSNPFFKSHYADLSSVWEACRGPLSENGLAVIQSAENEENGWVTVETILTHASGQWISGRLSMQPVKSDPQGVGSVITYLRRYSLSAMVGIAPEDDDANEASGKTSPPPLHEPQRASRPAAPPAENNFKKFLDSMAQMKAQIGEKEYYGVLGRAGVEHANEILERKKQEEVYRSLKERLEMTQKGQDEK